MNNLITQLIEHNESTRLECNPAYSLVDHAQEHATVYFSAGRIKGHSTYIRENASIHFDLIIVHSHEAERFYPDHCCLSAPKILRLPEEKVKSSRRIYIDGLHILHKYSMSDLYIKLVRDSFKQTFVVLGT